MTSPHVVYNLLPFVLLFDKSNVGWQGLSNRQRQQGTGYQHRIMIIQQKDKTASVHRPWNSSNTVDCSDVLQNAGGEILPARAELKASRRRGDQMCSRGRHERRSGRNKNEREPKMQENKPAHPYVSALSPLATSEGWCAHIQRNVHSGMVCEAPNLFRQMKPDAESIGGDLRNHPLVMDSEKPHCRMYPASPKNQPPSWK